MDALRLLHDDHELVRHLLSEGEEATSPTERGEALGSLAAHLAVHEQLEEELLYPAVEEADPKTVRSALDGHRAVDTMVDELRDLPIDEDVWSETFATMRDQLEDHLEEEERDVFDVAERVLGSEGLEVLGRRMETIRDAMIR
jgi:hemerythrin superfamily protein